MIVWKNLVEKKLQTYTIEIFESNSKLVEITAKTADEAKEIVMNKYLSGDIVLDKSCDYSDVQFNLM